MRHGVRDEFLQARANKPLLSMFQPVDDTLASSRWDTQPPIFDPFPLRLEITVSEIHQLRRFIYQIVVYWIALSHWRAVGLDFYDLYTVLLDYTSELLETPSSRPESSSSKICMTHTSMFFTLSLLPQHPLPESAASISLMTKLARYSEL